MLAFRSLALGLLAACAALLAARPVFEVHVVADAHRTPPSIIDAARGLTVPQLLGLVRLAPGEYVAAVDDHHPWTASELTAALHARTYVDLEVVGDAGVRRVVVLVH